MVNLGESGGPLQTVSSKEKTCSRCGSNRLKIWYNKKGLTCQKCGNLIILEETLGLENPKIVWKEGIWVEK